MISMKSVRTMELQWLVLLPANPGGYVFKSTSKQWFYKIVLPFQVGRAYNKY